MRLTEEISQLVGWDAPVVVASDEDDLAVETASVLGVVLPGEVAEVVDEVGRLDDGVPSGGHRCVHLLD